MADLRYIYTRSFTLKKLLVYVHGPHKGTLAIAEGLRIAESHRVHLRFGCIPVKVPKADLYFLEGLVPLIKGFGFSRKSRIIVKGNCQYAFYAQSNKLRKIIARLYAIIYPHVEIIAVSDLSAEGYRKLGFRNVRVCEGFMYRGACDLGKLANVGSNFIFIGQNGYLKGVEKSIELFLVLKRRRLIEGQSLFYLIGDLMEYLTRYGYNKEELDKLGVKLIGPTENILPYLRDCKYQLHLARHEPNAVSIMEGATSGLIPLMSTDTGNVSHLSQIFGKNSVYDWTSDKFDWIRIKEILNSSTSPHQLKYLEKYTRENGVQRWIRSFEQIGD